MLVKSNALNPFRGPRALTLPNVKLRAESQPKGILNGVNAFSTIDIWNKFEIVSRFKKIFLKLVNNSLRYCSVVFQIVTSETLDNMRC